jgi:hypothetical protein
MSINHSAYVTNLDKAIAAWGSDLPEWLKLLASACDRTSQRIVADRLNVSSPVISKVVRRCYEGGDYQEMETRVRAAFGREDVVCPIWGQAIPLSSCVRNRRRKGAPINHDQRRYARTCPSCPNNTDAPNEEA